MTVFSNTSGDPANRRTEYQKALIALVGTQDPFVVLESTPGWCQDMFNGLGPKELRHTEAPAKWSIADVLHHLADSELVWSIRLRKVIAEDSPVLTGYDQDVWARNLHYDTRSVELALSILTAVRSSNLELLRSLTAADLTKVGLHTERGPESVHDMLILYAGHDLVHRAQIERIRDSIG